MSRANGEVEAETVEDRVVAFSDHTVRVGAAYGIPNPSEMAIRNSER